jgi:hypothetical protein
MISQKTVILLLILAMFMLIKLEAIEFIVLSLTVLAEEVPVAVTAEIGHGTDARAARIGGLYHFREN